MTNPKDTRPDTGASQAIDRALRKTKQVAEEVKDAADELEVVHAVLESGMPGSASNPDVEKAVSRTQDLEKQLHESAEKLDAANQILENEQRSQP